MKKNVLQKNIKKLARLHIVFTLSIFVLYLALSILYSPEFLFSDVRNKFSAIAADTITITGRVLAPPIKPVVSVTIVCQNNLLSANIDWSDDQNSQAFSITKDGLTLITGLTDSQYIDESLTIGTTYIYAVTAHGTMGPGFALSDSVQVVTPDECGSWKPIPNIKITSFDNRSISSYKENVDTSEVRPLFSGTSTIKNALIKIQLTNDINIFSEITANANGYWSWTPPVKLDTGKHTISITATDPTDATRTASTSLRFEILKAETSTKNTNKKIPPTPVETQTENIAPVNTNGSQETTPAQETKLEQPFDFSLSLENSSIIQNKDLSLKITTTKILPKLEGQSAKIIYKIFDDKGVEVFSSTEERILRDNSSFTKKIALPKYITEGSKKIRVSFEFSENTIEKEASFTVTPLPALSLGGGIMMTYPELLSRLGTVALTMIVSISFWLFLFTREYWLYLHALRNITEKHLSKLGLVSVPNGRGVFK
jgi:hypothetical protein